MDSYPWERPLGAVPGDAYRVWAPNADLVSVGDVDLDHVGYGVWEGGEPVDGDDYHFTIDGQDFPDPASRWQPDGLRGPSRVVDPTGFEWSQFTPKSMAEQVIYEM